MRRPAVLLTLLTLAGLSTGAFDCLHQLNHQHQAAQWAAAMQSRAGQQNTPHSPANNPWQNDTTNCLICLTLHAPLTAAAPTPTITAPTRIAPASEHPPLHLFLTSPALPIHPRGPPTA